MNMEFRKVDNLKFLLMASFFVCLFSVNALAQKSRPTPTPPAEIPQVVSRDEDDLDTEINEVTEPTKNTNSVETSNLPKTNPTNETETETSKKQKRMLMYLDLLTKTEQRAASLRQQVFDLLEKTTDVTSKLSQVEYQMRPDIIASSMALTGSLRPEDIRQQRLESLKLEKANLEALLKRLEASRTGLENNLTNAELLVERVRLRFERAVEESLNADENDF